MGRFLLHYGSMRRNHWFGVAIVLALVGSGLTTAHAKGSVRITFTTTPAPTGQYTPNNVVAVWIQNAQGQHVRTTGVWSAVRTQYLLAYRGAAGVENLPLPADAVTGASRANHQGSLTLLWNLKDKAGNVVPDGTYTIRMEVAESNSTAQNQNNQGTFTFVKGPNPQMQTGLANGGFTNVTIDYDPNRVACGDGVTDTPETCDYAQTGSCIVNQTGCPGAADKCMPLKFTGDPMTCTADCVVDPITACVAGDMCCPAGCDEASDADCAAGGGGGNNNGGGGTDSTVTGGCSTSAGGGALLVLLVLLSSKRRRV
jgi:hypothetical protein